MGRYVDELGEAITQAARSSRLRFEYGTVKSISTGSAMVTIAGEDKPVRVPGHFRLELAEGQSVRVSVQDTTRTLDGIDDALPAPSVTASPADASSNSASTYTNSTVSSGCYDASSGDAFAYARDVAETTRFLAGDINQLRDDVETNEDAVQSVKATLNSVVTKLNALIDTVEGMRTAGVAQGRIS